MSPSFLDLPSLCREEIYLLSGLVRQCPIHFTTEHRRVKNGDTVHDACARFGYCACTYLKHRADSGMPRSAREREQFVCFGPPIPFSLFLISKEIYLETSKLFYSSNKFLLQVTDKDDLSWLSRLSPHARSAMSSMHINMAPKEINETERLATEISAILREFAKCWKPLQMSFTMTSQTTNMVATKILLESTKLLPQLRSCALSFAVPLPLDLELRSSIRAIGARSTGRAPKSQPFPFQNLPQELRLQILKNTDLIRRRNQDSAYGSILLAPQRSTSTRPRTKCCSRCNDCLEFCCCIWKPAAYSMYCNCASIQPSLFLAGRQTSQDSQEIFFSENIFVLRKPLDSIKLIEDLNDFQVSHVRRLELYFEECDEMMGWPFHRASVQPRWIHLIEVLRTRLDLGKLELRVNLASYDDSLMDEEPELDWEASLKEIVEPLKRLTGLRRLFIYLGCAEHIEPQLEKAIMGPSYDSLAEGKPPAFQDIW